MNHTTFDRSVCKENGIAFFKAACAIENSAKDIVWLSDMLIPYTVNIVFACELLLKCLIYPYLNDDETNSLHTHNIDELYDTLKNHNSDIINQIEDYYYTNGISESKERNSLDTALKMCSNNFESFRYSHEATKELKMHLSSIPTFARALIKVC